VPCRLQRPRQAHEGDHASAFRAHRHDSALEIVWCCCASGTRAASKLAVRLLAVVFRTSDVRFLEGAHLSHDATAGTQ
jgi:hypothetical protein